MNEVYFIVLNLIIIYLSNEDSINQVKDKDYGFDYDEEEVKVFKTNVKEYLTKNKIYGNETAEITPKQMKIIFRDIMVGDDKNEVPEEYRKPFQKLTTQFINEQYNKKKRTVIKGSEVFELFDIKVLNEKFNVILEEIAFNKDNDKDDNDDNLDDDNEIDTDL